MAWLGYGAKKRRCCRSRSSSSVVRCARLALRIHSFSIQFPPDSNSPLFHICPRFPAVLATKKIPPSGICARTAKSPGSSFPQNRRRPAQRKPPSVPFSRFTAWPFFLRFC